MDHSINKVNKNGNNLRIGFIGFGLIGGSIARAIKKIDSGITILAYNYQNGKPNADLHAALEDKTLDAITDSLETDICSCNIIFLCAPVLANIDYLHQLKPILKPDCVLTDVGSVKGNIHEEVKRLGLEAQFIGGHPMTGSEKTGYRNSDALLLENAYYIFTPTEQVPKENVELLLSLARQMGSIPILLHAEEHDAITAAISHMPHIIAAQLVNFVRNADDKAETMRTLAAGGFKDITRIASSSPVMWQNICLTNTSAIKEVLDGYIKSLQEASDALSRRDEEFLYTIFETAGEYRSSIPNTAKGIFEKVYEIYLDITDEAGAIATIATQLAINQISIKNIGIIHNREFEEGVLRIEFYNQDSVKKAIDVLEHFQYHLYIR
ncbi:MAG: prephenate dehydrogenase [Lachnospiraceae bacterium]|jgi:prephenate dehydrogenase|nr:prephenate dehydrogenase [Lachnospiraceae bacterium]